MGKENGQSKRGVTSNCRCLETNRNSKKSTTSLTLFPPVHWPLLIWVQSWGSCNYYFAYISPPPQEKHSLAGGCSSKNSSLKQNSLNISISIAEAICLKVTGKMQARIKRKSEEQFVTYTHTMGGEDTVYHAEPHEVAMGSRVNYQVL